MTIYRPNQQESHVETGEELGHVPRHGSHAQHSGNCRVSGHDMELFIQFKDLVELLCLGAQTEVVDWFGQKFLKESDSG